MRFVPDCFFSFLSIYLLPVARGEVDSKAACVLLRVDHPHVQPLNQVPARNTMAQLDPEYNKMLSTPASSVNPHPSHPSKLTALVE